MREVGLRGLREKQGSEHVDLVGGVEVVHCHGGEQVVSRHAGIVDDDIDLEGAVGLQQGAVALYRFDQGLGAFDGSEIRLDR